MSPKRSSSSDPILNLSSALRSVPSPRLSLTIAEQRAPWEKDQMFNRRGEGGRGEGSSNQEGDGERAADASNYGD
jgi:hypothetical protein